MKNLIIIIGVCLLSLYASAQNKPFTTVKYNKDLVFEVSYYKITNSIYIVKNGFEKTLPKVTHRYGNNGDKFESIEKLYQIFNETFTAKELQQLANADAQLEIDPYWNPDGKVFEVSFYVKRKTDFFDNEPFLKQIPISLSKLVKLRELFIKEIRFQPTHPQLIESLPYCRTGMDIKINDIVNRTFEW